VISPQEKHWTYYFNLLLDSNLLSWERFYLPQYCISNFLYFLLIKLNWKPSVDFLSDIFFSSRLTDLFFFYWLIGVDYLSDKSLDFLICLTDGDLKKENYPCLRYFFSWLTDLFIFSLLADVDSLCFLFSWTDGDIKKENYLCLMHFFSWLTDLFIFSLLAGVDSLGFLLSWTDGDFKKENYLFLFFFSWLTDVFFFSYMFSNYISSLSSNFSLLLVKRVI
jgi:hypothetical protein